MPDDAEQIEVTSEQEAFYIDVARKYVELDLRIRRQIDLDLPRHRSKEAENPDAGVHDDIVQAARLVLLENHGKIVKSGMSRAYCKSLLRVIPADHSYRTSGWKLSEWDSKQLHSAIAMAEAEAPNADDGTKQGLARRIYIDNGGDPLVFDTVYGEPLSLFVGDEYEDEGYYDYLDLMPDPAPGPEEQVVDGDEHYPGQRSITEYMAEVMDEADREFVETLLLFKEQGKEQRDAAKVLHMKDYEVTRRKNRIMAAYQSWKCTEGFSDESE